MANLSYITTGVKERTDITYNIPTDESVGAILFDISGFNNPFDNYPLLYHNFKDNTVNLIQNMDEADLLGIKNDDFLNGVLYYHISQFYNLVGKSHPLYIAIADCSKDWDVLWNMQQQVNGKLFHIGVWTSQPIWKMNINDTLGFTNLITDLQNQADIINGKIDNVSFSTTPLDIVLCANSNFVERGVADFRRLPDATKLNCPKVSVVLAQNGSPEIHTIQDKNPKKAPVSVIGQIMAFMAICGAEESIASLKKCDLNKNENFNYPELGFGVNNSPLNNMHDFILQAISFLGYITPISYKGLESSYFFSSDQTLCDGDFSTIANNRIIHKCRRAVCTAMIKYISSHHIYIPGTHTISETSMSIIRDSINSSINTVMINSAGKNQIDGCSISFDNNDSILDNDFLNIEIKIKPVGYDSFIVEKVSHSVL